MSMDQLLPAFFEELEKLGVSKRDAYFTKARRGRRPIRAHKLLEKETSFSRPPKDESTGESASHEHEYGGGMEEKLGSDERSHPKRSAKRKAIRAAVEARPWVSSAFKGAIPAAIAANFLIPASSPTALKHKSRIVAGFGALGAGAGITDRALKNWARKNPRFAEAKELKKQGAAMMRKIAALAADLRMKGLGGVKRPPFATEDSKRFAFNQLRNAKAPGYFTSRTQAKHLYKPGPTIKQISATVGG